MAASELKLQSMQSHLLTSIFILSMYLYMDLEFFFFFRRHDLVALDYYFV